MDYHSQAFRQICDKPSSQEILSMLWNPRSDLISVLTLDGEVRLHRLYWSKVWSFVEKPSKNTAIAWSPDGKILAVGSEDGMIRLVEIEKCHCIYSNFTSSKVTCLEWIATNEESMTVLISGDQNGNVELFVNGTFRIASIKNTDSPMNHSITNLHLSRDLQLLWSIQHFNASEDNNETYTISFQEAHLLSSRIEEIAAIATKYEKITKLIQKFEEELKQTTDSWKDILQKVSSKLGQFSRILPKDTSVSDEFLVAFACGTLSAELQSFLFNDLTVKGLRKLGTDVNVSYANIKSHVVDKIQSLCYDLSFNLSELLGMSRWYEKYGILGLCEKAVQDTLNYLGAFMLKIRELISVIDQELKSFRAFFKWLSGVMLRISDEPVPSNFREFSQEEHAHILNFLRTQLVKKEGQDAFTLERVGQYVQKGDLGIRKDHSTNPWYQFVSTSPSLRDNPLIIQPESPKSLPDMSTELRKKINNIFEKITNTITESVSSKGCSLLYEKGSMHDESCKMRISCSSDGADTTCKLCFLPCTCESERFYMIRMNKENIDNLQYFGCGLDIGELRSQEKQSGNTVIKDISFYNDETLTLLAEDKSRTESTPLRVLAQLPTDLCFNGSSSLLPVTANTSQTCNNISSGLIKWRYFESFDPMIISVSGTRRVSCLLSKNRRRVQIFDMDAEEDEDVDEADEMDDD